MKINFSNIIFDKIYLEKVYTLSKQQRKVAFYMAKGAKTSEIAKILNLKPNTVSTVKKTVFSKLKISSQVDLYAKYHTFL